MTHSKEEENLEKNLLDIADSDLRSATHARTVVKAEIGYTDGDLP